MLSLFDQKVYNRNKKISRAIFYNWINLVLDFEKKKSQTQLDLKLCYNMTYSNAKLATLVEGDPNAPFLIATTPR